MSDSSQGPGWWQASDGRWYAPEQHPDRQQPAMPAPPAPAAFGAPTGYTPPGYAPPGAPPPGYAPPGVPAPAPGYAFNPGGAPAKSGMSGGQKAALIVVCVLLLGIGGCAVAVGALLHRGASKINQAAGDLSGKNGCPFLSTSKAASVIDGQPVLVPLRGFASLAGVALDGRVLRDAPSCMFSPKDGQQGPTGRIARLQSGDAKKVFTDELTQAKGVTVDKGNGLSVTSEGYFAKTAEVGDEAFCTSSGVVPMAGMLVRKGDVVVYVSLLPTDEQLKKITEGGIAANDDDLCQAAGKIASAVIG